MAELAPFVAAVLKDEAVAEMVEENTKLIEENKKLKRQLYPWTVTIHSTVDETSETGDEKAPIVYATGKVNLWEIMDDMIVHGLKVFNITLEANDVNPCKISDLCHASIRITPSDDCLLSKTSTSKLLPGSVRSVYASPDGFLALSLRYIHTHVQHNDFKGWYLTLNIPIPAGKEILLTPDSILGLQLPCPLSGVINIAREITDDGPVEFQRVKLSLLGLLRGR